MNHTGQEGQETGLMRCVYRLRDDQSHISAVQKATLTTAEFGIEPTHGLFGSDEWWAQVEDGRLALRTISGVITRVFMSGHNDYPEFEMKDDAGRLSQWTRETSRPEDDSLYVPGRNIEIDVVVQRHRSASWDKGAETDIVFEIRINPA